MTNHEIASAYVRYYLEGADADFWAVETLDEMAGNNPENAWSIIRRINSIHIKDRVWREHVYGVLGCGALETLIVVHRDTMLPQARQLLELNETDYRSGKSSFLDLIDTQRTILRFELQLARSLADSQIHLADIERLTGRSAEE